MAAGMGQVSGSYNQKVADPDKDQADSKFGNHGGAKTVKMSSKEPSQSSGKSSDSKDSKVS